MSPVLSDPSLLLFDESLLLLLREALSLLLASLLFQTP